MNPHEASFLSVKPSKRASFCAYSGSEWAFTLTELLVVIAVVAVLGSLVFPALAATHDRSNRAMCQFNLRQIALAVTQYAGENNDYIFPASHNVYPLQWDWMPSTQSFLARVGITTNAGGIWTCPNRPALPLMSGTELVLGYQYYGGITNWINNAGNFPSHSPIKMSQSKPYWMLAADLVAQPDGINWQGPGDPGVTGGWAQLPAHHTADTIVPQGGNEVFADGSVQWIDIHKMYMLHSWSDPSAGGAGRYLYFYQDLSDYPELVRRLPALYQAGVTSPGAHF